MQTSYFAGAKNNYLTAVSIALQTPDWFTGKKYPDLNPTPFVMVFEDRPNLFKRYYQEMILDRLNPFKVYQELGDRAVLLCWERSGKFCHRRLVAAWLEKEIGVEIPEINYHGNTAQENLFMEECSV